MASDRRTLLLGIGGLVAGGSALVSGSSALQTDRTLWFSTVAAEQEYAVLSNSASDPFDLTGYYMELEYGQQVSQRRQFPDGTAVPANGSLVIASGAEPVENADVTFDYERAVINDDNPDRLALIAPDGSTAVVTGGQGQPPTATPTPDPTSKPTTTQPPEPTTEATETSTEEPTETPTSTEEPTETTSEPTETPTSEPTETATPEPEVDSDNDGLTDAREEQLGTDPNDPDTDGDKLSDMREQQVYGTDPLAPDTDDDGYNDCKEMNIYGTDPTDPDDKPE
jgi:hypothetical protein